MEIENIMDIDKKEIIIIISSALLKRRSLWKQILHRDFDFLY